MEFYMKWLNCQETINKLKEQNIPVRLCNSYEALAEGSSGIKENLNNITEIRVIKEMFLINKLNAEVFFTAVSENIKDPYFKKIVDVLKVYAYLDYLLYTICHNGFSVSTRDLEATYIKRTPVKKKDVSEPPEVRLSNLCLEIPLGPIMKCTIQAKNTEYDFKDLYEKVIYPAFKEMLKTTIDVDIKSIDEFNNDMFDLLKMARI
jgi:hypothetical protein